MKGPKYPHRAWRASRPPSPLRTPSAAQSPLPWSPSSKTGEQTRWRGKGASARKARSPPHRLPLPPAAIPLTCDRVTPTHFPRLEGKPWRLAGPSLLPRSGLDARGPGSFCLALSSRHLRPGPSALPVSPVASWPGSVSLGPLGGPFHSSCGTSPDPQISLAPLLFGPASVF